ncbi:MAG: glycoside hydrolase family 3 protein [Clostridia bacterium]|nr:glycoside hydrolase family 3 protein [Clostridia bacterium]
MIRLNSKLSKWILFAFTVVILCSCDEKSDIDTNENVSNIDDTESEITYQVSSNDNSILDSMTTEEKVGQLFFIRPEQLIDDSYVNDEAIVAEENEGVFSVSDQMRKMYAQYPVGGFTLFAKNIDTPSQLSQFTSDLISIGTTDTIITVDEEGGIVTRLAQNPAFGLPLIDDMENIGSTNDVTNAYAAGDTIGGYLADYNIFWNFAPDADLNTNPNNIVIGSRSFGSDPILCSKMVRSYIDGLHAHGVKSTLKHFPGHGDTTDDTHSGYVSVEKTWEELKQTEIFPFAENLDATDAVMIAHITLPNVTSDGLPASMSHELITGKLRDELGFDGVVICDSLAMGAVTENYASDEAAVLAFEAGCDVLLTPQNFYEAYKGILNAVNSGEITQERLDESVARILEIKGNIIN